MELVWLDTQRNVNYLKYSNAKHIHCMLWLLARQTKVVFKETCTNTSDIQIFSVYHTSKLCAPKTNCVFFSFPYFPIGPKVFPNQTDRRDLLGKLPFFPFVSSGVSSPTGDGISTTDCVFFPIPFASFSSVEVDILCFLWFGMTRNYNKLFLENQRVS